MEPFNKIEKYCEDVCSQIRWKAIRPQISLEIQNHIIDQRDAYISDGDDESTATEKAILQMGDPIEIGEELDRTHKPEKQWFMIGLVGVFMAIGLIVKILIYTYVTEQVFFIDRLVIQYFIAFCIFIACYSMDFSMLGKHPFAIYISSLIIAIILFVIEIKYNGNVDLLVLGSCRIRYQAMFMIFTLSFTLIVYKMRNKGYRGILSCGLLYLPFAIILYLSNTIGFYIYTTVSLIAICYAIYKDWFKVDKKIGLTMVLVPTVSAVSFVFLDSVFEITNMTYKFEYMLDGIRYKENYSYIYSVTKEMLNGAVFIGRGTIPEYEAYTISEWEQFPLSHYTLNYPLTYAIYRFGYISLVIVVALVLTFYIFSMKKVFKEKSMLGSLIIITVSTIFIIQSINFILLNTWYWYGDTLPFMFSDGLSLFITSMLVGFMLSVFKTGEAFSDNINYDSKRVHS